MVGREYEAGGIAKDGAKLVTAVSCAEVPKFTVVIGGSLRRRQLRHVRPGLRAAPAVDVAQRPDLGDGRRAGRHGADRRGRRPRRGAAPTIERYEREGSPYHSTARLWDDGVIDPLDTRRVLALGLDAASRAPVPADDLRGVPDVSEVLLERKGAVATLTLEPARDPKRARPRPDGRS